MNVKRSQPFTHAHQLNHLRVARHTGVALRSCILLAAAVAATAGCNFAPKSSRLSNDTVAAGLASTPGFQSFRKTGDGFEGIYLRITANPMKSADVLFRVLGDLEKEITKFCDQACRKSQADSDKDLLGLTWSIQPFGPTMGDFIFVPNKEVNARLDAAPIQKLVAFLISKQKDLGIPKSSTGDYMVQAVDTPAAKKLFENIFNSEENFPKSQIGAKTIDTRDTEWALELTNTKEAHRQFFTSQGKLPGEGARVTVIDTGITDHPELQDIRRVTDASGAPVEKDFVLPESLQDRIKTLAASNFPTFGAIGSSLLNFVGIKNSLTIWGPMMNPNHGTSSVSLVASSPNKEKPSDRAGFTVTGTAYGAEILVAKVSNSVILTTGKNAADAIKWAADNGTNVISMSIGGLDTPVLYDAVQYATSKGVVIVAAAGTGTGPVTVYPANYSEVVSVASVDQNCHADDQTSYSQWVDVAAPGKNAWFAWSLARPNGDHEQEYIVRQAFGTSLATPHMAGIAALWIAHHGPEKLATKYGPENISTLLKYVLQLKAAPGHKAAVNDCPDAQGKAQFDGTKEGSPYQGQLGYGVIDAQALLNVDLSKVSKEEVVAWKLSATEKADVEGEELGPKGTRLSVQARKGFKAAQKEMRKKLEERLTVLGKINGQLK